LRLPEQHIRRYTCITADRKEMHKTAVLEKNLRDTQLPFLDLPGNGFR
jgi:hypothetical protein